MQINQNQRLNVLRDRLAGSPYDALLIASTQNCRYLSGMANDDPHVAYLLVSDDNIFLVTDYRYSLQAKTQCHPGIEVIERDRARVSLGQQFNILLKQMNVQQIYNF